MHEVRDKPMDGGPVHPLETLARQAAADAAVPSPPAAEEAVLSVRQQRQSPLYASRVKVYPARVAGRFRRIKWAVLSVLLAIYYVLPWIRWDRGPGVPDQAVLIDLARERGYFFFIEIWPQEVYYITGLLLLGAIGLFLVTSLAGRIWCGFTCPQTVWTDLFLLVERWVEGDRNARIRLDKAPWSAAKLGRKALKHAIWLVIAGLTGGAWIMYFNDAPTVIREIFTGEASPGVYFFVGLFTATTYLLAGLAREQVCTYMCPWPRFQAAMFDEDTLIIGYDRPRGEPRGKRAKAAIGVPRGDCVDCLRCVAVCPTGIDIRDGVQMQCIGCGLCIDACDEVMGKLGRPAHLIRYESERNQAERAAGLPRRLRLLRPRTALYALMFLTIAGGMLWMLAWRSSVDINVLHERTPLFVTLSDGAIRNDYTVKILNMQRRPRRFALALDGLPGSALGAVGREPGPDGRLVLDADPDGVSSYRVFVRLARDRLTSDTMPFAFVLRDGATGETVVQKNVFRGPGR